MDDRRKRLQPVPPRADPYAKAAWLNNLDRREPELPVSSRANPNASEYLNVNRNSGSSGSSSEDIDLEMPRTPKKTVTYQDVAEEIPVKIRDAEDDDEEDYEGENDDTLSASIIEEMANIDLKRNPSSATNASASSAKTIKSSKSAKSVLSVKAIGSFGLGTLRVHDANIPEEGTTPACLQNGDVVLISDVPGGVAIGYDMISLTIQSGLSFQGIREFPPGVHFVWGGSPSPIATRTGFWLVSQKLATGVAGHCHVLAWNKYTDTLDEQVVQAEKRIQKMEVGDAYDSCYPYNLKGALAKHEEFIDCSATDILDEAKLWNDLTFAIKGSMLTRITGRGWNQWKITASCDSLPLTEGTFFDRPRPVFDAQQQLKLAITGFEPTLKFAFIRGSKTFSRAAIGSQRTEQAIDSSTYVRGLVVEKCNHQNAEELVGEMQFSYISGMFLGNINCMEQFVFIARVVFRAYAWSIEEPVVFAKFIRALNAILNHDDRHIEGSIFEHNPDFQDELKRILILFKSRLTEQLLALGETVTKDMMELSKTFEKLEAWLLKNWDWDLRGNFVKVGQHQLEDGEYVDAEMEEYEAEDERGEYAPVIIELDKDGREKGTLSW